MPKRKASRGRAAPIVPPATTAAADNRAAAVASLHRDWAKRGAAVHSSIKFDAVGGDDEDFGVYAKEPLAAGERVYSVPAKLLLTPGTMARSALGDAVRAVAQRAALPEPDDETVMLLCFCIGVADAAHPSHLHFKALPTRDPTPLSWAADARTALAGTSLGDKCELAEQRLHATTDALCSALTSGAGALCQPPALTWERRCWAWGMYLSRRFFFSDKAPLHPDAPAGKGRTWTEPGAGWVIPCVDMLNHADTPNCSLEISDDDVSVLTTAAIKQGDQLTISYGIRGNEALLQSYGFALQANVHDFYPVMIACDAPPAGDDGAALQELRLEIIDAASLSHTVNADGSIDVGPLPLLAPGGYDRLY